MSQAPYKRLAAVLFVDIVGFTQLSSVDEPGSLRTFAERLGHDPRYAAALREVGLR